MLRDPAADASNLLKESGGKLMLKYTTKRLLYSIIILFFVMFIIYTLMYSMPNNYIEQKARELASKPGAGKSYTEWLADLNAQYGMDKGLVAGYFT